MERYSKNVSSQNTKQGSWGGREAMDLIYNALDSKPWCLG